MRLGNKIYFILFFVLFISVSSIAEEKILSTPLINLDQLTPSFEEEAEASDDILKVDTLKNKKKMIKKNTSSSVKLIGLDKITAKTSEIIIKLGETKKFGQLEIKALKCGKLNSENFKDNVAYLQVKDISENEDDKVFIFNGWTFSSDPTLAPFDHAIYDLQLVNCSKV